jgi:hypothetical protein
MGLSSQRMLLVSRSASRCKSTLCLLTMFLLLISASTHAKECKTPDLRSTVNERFEEIGFPYPDYFVDSTVIAVIFYWQNLQWIGLYWDGPTRGAILAYDCEGNLLSIQQAGGVKSVQFFSAPNIATSAVSVEEICTGTGFYQVKQVIYAIIDGKISKLWEHTKYESNYGTQGGRIVDSFDFVPSKLPDDTVGGGWRKIRVDGVRRIYPPNGKDFDFHVEKLKTESYCWDGEKISYRMCK